MPSGVRARAREERERQAAQAAAARAVAQAEVVRRRQRLDKLGVRRPSLSRPGRQSGSLARRRRIQLQVLLAGLIVLNALLWFAEPSPSIRALALVASVLVAPVLYTVLFRKA